MSFLYNSDYVCERVGECVCFFSGLRQVTSPHLLTEARGVRWKEPRNSVVVKAQCYLIPVGHSVRVHGFLLHVDPHKHQPGEHRRKQGLVPLQITDVRTQTQTCKCSQTQPCRRCYTRISCKPYRKNRHHLLNQKVQKVPVNWSTEHLLLNWISNIHVLYSD